jgi:TRAP-type C4-dicarboxylate transport system permease small subunit
MLSRLAQRLDRALAVLLAALLATIVLAVTWQAVSRYVFASPSGWTEELARFLLVWIGTLGGALAYQRRLHLGIDLLPETLRRRRIEGGPGSTATGLAGAVAIVIDGAVLVFALAVLVLGGGALVALTLELEQYSPALGLPMALVYLALPASGLLLSVSALAALVDGGVRHVGLRDAP